MFPQAVWVWEGAPDWKNEILAYLQLELKKAGITNEDHIRNIIAVPLIESGVNPEAVGDHGCSYGAYQKNHCAHDHMLASRYIQLHPEWKDPKVQTDWFVQRTVAAYEKYNQNIFRTIVQHNAPSFASKGLDTPVGYGAKVIRWSLTRLR